jgi:LPS export ABC transporter protein LptC
MARTGKARPLRGKIALCLGCFWAFSCTFDYGQTDESGAEQPDIVMENVEYVRVRSADPVARFRAEQAARYEVRQIMELKRLSFEQFGNHGEEVNAFGRVGSAAIEIDTNNIRMYDGVRLEVESEDIAIETRQLEWKDKERLLSGGPNGEVNIIQENGTRFTGTGFEANARTRTWQFARGVRGTYVHEDKEEDTNVEIIDTETVEAGVDGGILAE